MPFRYLCIYILSLLFISGVGPVKYDFDYFYFFLVVIYILLFLLVTSAGMNSMIKYKPRYINSNEKKKKTVSLINTLIIINLPIKIALVVSSIITIGMPTITTLFETMATAYSDMHNEEMVVNVWRQLDTFTTFLFYISTFTGFYWFKNIQKSAKFVLFINILLDLFYCICFIGTQRSIVTLVILFLTIFLVKIRRATKEERKKYKRIFGFTVLCAVILFSNVLLARKTLWADGDIAYNAYGWDYNNWMIFLIPSMDAKYALCNLISYLTQGFYGLSLAFQVPFEWTYGLGGMRGLNSIVSQISPIPILEDHTYPLRAGKVFGVDGLASWYTMFPWIASDWTFLGTLLLMYFIAKLFMKCWIQVIKCDNPLAFVMLTLLVMMYVFSIANNQLFVERGESFATIVIGVLYFLYNDRYNFIIKNE